MDCAGDVEGCALLEAAHSLITSLFDTGHSVPGFSFSFEQHTGYAVLSFSLSLSCGTFYLHPQLRAIDPEVQFTQLYPETLPSGENILAVEYGLRRFGALRIVSRSNFRDVLRQAYEVETDSPFELLEDDDSIFHDKAGQAASIELMRRWISTCEQHHGPSCSGIWRGMETPRGRSIVLIDVRNRCLLRMPMTGSRYFALSYVWGTSAIPKTTKAISRAGKSRCLYQTSCPQL